MTSISVVIPCFNAERWIGETLESVFRQDVAEIDVIVVDDGSTDRSVQIVQRSFPNVRLVRTANGGPSRARNIGTRLARGAFIQYLDADDVLAPGKLERQLRALEHTGADIAYGDWAELRQSVDGSFLPAREVKRYISGEAATALLTDFWSPPAVYLFRRSIVDRIGGWDEEQPLIEDVRLILTCALHGATFTYTPGMAAWYRVRDKGSLSTSDATAFTLGCLRNALTAEEWWLRNEGLSNSRKTALLQAYGHVARASFGLDDATFETAYAALKRLDPAYVPAGPRPLMLASRFIGYRSAEAVAFGYRRAKRRLQALAPLTDR